MEISQTKQWFVKKTMSICLAIIVLITMTSENVIAEEYKIISNPTKKASLLEEVRVNKVEVQVITKEEVEIKEAVITKEEDTKIMPIYSDMSEETKKYWGYKVKGTDKWNNLIEKVSEEEGIDPIFVKCIMAIESSGNQKVVNRKNKNGTSDYGLMQVNTGWGSEFNYKLMLENPEYAIRSGIKVIKYKIAAAEKKGKQATAFEILWRYNGKSAQGKRYATKVVKLYEDLSQKTRNDSIVMNNNEQTEKIA